MARPTRWKLRQRDNRERLHSNRDVMASRTGAPGGEQPVGSRLSGPHGVGAPAVTGEDVPATGGHSAEALVGKPERDRGPRGSAPSVEGRGTSGQAGRVERTIPEPKELDNAE